MSELLSLRSYRRALYRSDGSAFRVQWSEDGQTLSWAHGRLTLEVIRQLGQRVLADAASSTCSLMCGLESKAKHDET